MTDQSRILLLAEPAIVAILQAAASVGRWGGLPSVHSVAEAERRSQTDPWDVLVVDGHLAALPDPFPPQLLVPPGVVLMLAEQRPSGPFLWGPRGLALSHPVVLQASLDQATALAEQSRRLAEAEERSRENQTQMDHLLRLLGVGTPALSPRWHSQRVMLERLGEEVARVERHGGTLSVILAELADEPDPGSLVWIAEQLTSRKRFCDVIGQYGPQGFMLLLPQTTQVGARECYERLSGVLHQARTAPGQPQLWHLDYGVASYQRPHTSLKSLLREAEEQLAMAQGNES